MPGLAGRLGLARPAGVGWHGAVAPVPDPPAGGLGNVRLESIDLWVDAGMMTTAAKAIVLRRPTYEANQRSRYSFTGVTASWRSGKPPGEPKQIQVWVFWGNMLRGTQICNLFSYLYL